MPNIYSSLSVHIKARFHSLYVSINTVASESGGMLDGSSEVKTVLRGRKLNKGRNGTNNDQSFIQFHPVSFLFHPVSSTFITFNYLYSYFHPLSSTFFEDFCLLKILQVLLSWLQQIILVLQSYLP